MSQNESPEYYLGKVAAHAFADEMRELMAGYEKIAGDPMETIRQMAASAPKNVISAGKKAVSSLPKPDVMSAAGKYVAPVAQKAQMVDPLAGL